MIIIHQNHIFTILNIKKKNYDIIILNYSNITSLDIKILYQLLNISFYSLNLFPRFTSGGQKLSASRKIRVVERSFNKFVVEQKNRTKNTSSHTRQKVLTQQKTPTKQTKTSASAISIIEKKIIKMPKIIMSENSFVISPTNSNNKILDSYCYPNDRMLLSHKLLIMNGQLGPNTNGGIFNPGYIKHNDKVYILCRSEKIGRKYRYYNGLGTSIPILCELNRTESGLVLENSWEMDINVPTSIRVEDFRLYHYKDNVYSNHVIYYFKMEVNCESQKCCSMAVSKVDMENKKLNFLYELRYKNELYEKNWGFINKDDNIYIVKNLVPYTILKLDHDSGKCEKHTKKYYNILNRYRWSMSTNPIVYNDEYYITFIHKYLIKNKKKLYSHYILLIDRDTLLPKLILPKPIFSMEKVEVGNRIASGNLASLGELCSQSNGLTLSRAKQANEVSRAKRDCRRQFDPSQNYIHYISSISVEDNKLYVYFGESDINVGYSILDKEILDKEISNKSVKID